MSELHDLIMLHGPLDEHDQHKVKRLYHLCEAQQAVISDLRSKGRVGQLERRIEELENLLDEIGRQGKLIARAAGRREYPLEWDK